MSDRIERLRAAARDYRLRVAADGREANGTPAGIMPPSDWEEVRQIMQTRLRRFTGEPGAIVNFEFPADASL